jgi:hypothetical protein
VNKRLCLSTAALTLLSPLAAFADEPTGPTVWDGFSGWLSPDWSRDFSATLGVKVWINEWSRDSFISQPAFGPSGDVVSVTDTGPDSQESGIEAVPIPQLSARYKWLFVTGSYYSKTNFDFEPTFATVRAVDSAGNPVGAPIINNTGETSGERYEWDASGGIYVHPYVAILGGYKKVRQTIDQTLTTTFQGASDVSTSSSKIDIEGPTIGIAASVPIGRGFGVYATYAHGFMDSKIRDVVTTPPCCSDSGTQKFDADYDVAEAGFSYTHGMDQLMPHLPLSAATVYAGYRYQAISTDFQKQRTQDRSDVTRGFAVGVNLTF